MKRILKVARKPNFHREESEIIRLQKVTSCPNLSNEQRVSAETVTKKGKATVPQRGGS
jgi:hypothetical protein